MEGRYRFLLFISGMIQGLFANLITGFVGGGFLLLGVAVSFPIFQILGALILVFYLLISVIRPIHRISKILAGMEPHRIKSLMEQVISVPKGSIYRKFMMAVESPAAGMSNWDAKHRKSSISGKKQSRTVYSEPPERGISGGKIRYPDTVRPAMVKVFGICFLLASIYFLISSFSTYFQQLDARDWRVSMATVTDVSSYFTSTGFRGTPHLVYDIDYEYYINQDVYTGEITGMSDKKQVGDSFDIKYDSDSPEHSTDILEPRTDSLVVNIAFSLVFVVFGLWCLGVLSFLFQWIKRQNKRENFL